MFSLKLTLLVICAFIQIIESVDRSFVIDYENSTFLKDGKPFRYISGSLHYFRVPNEYWEDRMRKYRMAGLNTVQTYIEWSTHELRKGQFDFSGDSDIFKFMKLAQEQNLLVILRLGPYICAERQNGGLPAWLKSISPDMKVRTADPKFMTHVKDWFDYLLPQLRPYLYVNGGPVIMAQIENEYGSYFACDYDYQKQLKSLVQQHFNDEVVLFTTDGAGDNYLKCGQIDGVLPAIDFGAKVKAKDAFDMLRKHLPKGPLINNEFYPGWLDHWSEKHNRVSIDDTVKSIDDILSLGASINIYMMHGGTNFGFTNGANYDGKNYLPTPTSYDYDAPINEFGNLTEKYFAVQSALRKYAYVKKVAKTDFVNIFVAPPVKLQLLEKNLLDILLETSNPKNSPETLQFECLGVQYGYVLYKTKINFKPKMPAQLTIKGLRDRAYVYVDGMIQAVLSRSNGLFSSAVIAKKGSELMILVEDQGRVNFGELTGETKGISEVLLGDHKLQNWQHYGTQNWTSVEDEIYGLEFSNKEYNFIEQKYKPRFYRGEFEIDNEKPEDMLIDSSGWMKGVIWVNGKNIGKYWPQTGPQVTLYLPGVWLHKGKNTIIVMEQEENDCSKNKCSIAFSKQLIIDADVPE